MKRGRFQGARSSFLFAVLFAAGFSVESHAITITPNWDASVTQQAQKDVILSAINDVEIEFPGNTNFTITIRNAPIVTALGPAPNEQWAVQVVDGVIITVASTGNFQPDSNGCPISATTTFNTDTTKFKWSWVVGGTGEAGRVDGRTISRHELLHAIGFAENYLEFAGKVIARKFQCGNVMAQLVAEVGKTHLDSTIASQSGDLMITVPRATGMRTPISALDRNMLLCAFSTCYPRGGGGGPDTSAVPLTSAGGKVGLIVLLALGGTAAIFAFSRKKLAG